MVQHLDTRVRYQNGRNNVCLPLVNIQEVVHVYNVSEAVYKQMLPIAL